MKRQYMFMVILALLLSLSPTLPLAAQEDTEVNKVVVTRYIEEIGNHGNTDLMDQLFTEDFVLHDTVAGIVSRGSFAGGVLWNHDSLYENEMVNLDYSLLAQGDWVAELYIIGGIKQGTPIAAPEIDIMRLENGQIAEMWAVYDYWLIGQQTGGSAPSVRLFPALGDSNTSPEENIALVERAVEMWNSGNTDDAANLYADNLRFYLPLSVSPQELHFDDVIQYIGWLHTTMPDFSMETEGRPVVAEGNLVVYGYTFSASFARRAGSRVLPVNAEAADLYRIEDGKIVEVWWNWYSQNPLARRQFMPPVEE